MPKLESNPYGLRVDLKTEDEAVEIIVRKKEGEDFAVVENETFNASDVHDDLKGHIVCYGLSKILQDRTSDTKAGPDKLAAMREVMAQLSAGTWEKERAVGAPTVSPEVEALARIKNASIPDIQRALKKFTPEQREKVLSNDKVVALADEIRRDRASSQSEVDVTDLL
jgi:hypothetical protein